MCVYHQGPPRSPHHLIYISLQFKNPLEKEIYIILVARKIACSIQFMWFITLI